MKLLLNLIVTAATVCTIVYLLVVWPRVMSSPHPVQYVGYALLLVAGLVVLFAWAIFAAIPRAEMLQPLDASHANDLMLHVMDEAESLGYTLAGPILAVKSSVQAWFVGMVHQSGKSYATVMYVHSDSSPVTSYDVITIFEGGGSLTTGPTVSGAISPSQVGSFREVIPDASFTELHEVHQRSVAWLEQQGAVTVLHRAEDFDAHFADAMRQARAHFLGNPIGYTLVTLFRYFTKSTPHIGPIAEQRSTPRLLRQWRRRHVW